MGTGTSKCGIGTKLPLPLFFIMGTGASKCGTGTKLLLPLIPVSVPVPIIMVLIPLCRNF